MRAWRWARSLARKKRAAFFAMLYILYVSDAGSWWHGWDVGPTMPSNQLDGPRNKRVKRRNKRERRREMMRKRRKRRGREDEEQVELGPS
uniref:Uncharacterized protein n=1 Tax=Oryza rufipogon TaxID=4529 RepID=A0A0E0MX26_ORYRU